MRKSTAYDVFSEATYHSLFGVAVVLLRVGMGVLFFWAGWTKVMDPNWSAQGYLQSASGPFAEWFQSLAGSSVIDVLNMWGLTLIGVALILGLLVRTASVGGMLLMGLYYFAHFAENTARGFMEEHVIYAFVFFLLLSGGFGHVFGLDGIIERRLRGRSTWTRIFFG